MAHKKWLCIICGFIYDEAEGWPDEGIAPGTAWEEVPEDWVCPDCLVGKADFEMIEICEEDVPRVAATASAAATEQTSGSVVIIGSGHSGYQLASALRAHSPTLPIVVFTQDCGALYSKPALSCALAMNKTAEQLQLQSALEWEAKLNIRVYPHTEVLAIDRQQQRLDTRIGCIQYARLVLATGASPIVPDIPGCTSALQSVNHLHDYSSFRQKLEGKRRIAILGDGLIGCEFAHDLVHAGYEVTVIGRGRWPMSTLLPQAVGEGLQQSLSAAGVKWCLGTTVETAKEHDDKSWSLMLSDGQTLQQDGLLCAVGLQPNVKLARQSGLQTARGICVNRFGQTSDPHIFALGDCAEYPDGWRPYIAPINQAIPAMVSSLCGQLTPVDTTPAPVIVKTPSSPLSFAAPLRTGEWRIEHRGSELLALHYDDSDMLTGFALLGGSLQTQRNDWMREVLSTFSRQRVEEET